MQNSFSSFEDLAKSGKLEGYDYDFLLYKKSYSDLEHYGVILRKIAKIDEKRKEFYECKNDLEFLNGIESVKQLKSKIQKILFSTDKPNENSKDFNPACHLNSFLFYNSDLDFMQVYSKYKNDFIRLKQELKQVISEQHIDEYSNALLAKKSFDGGYDFYHYESLTTTEKEYHYTRMLIKFIIYYEAICKRKGIKFTNNDFLKWLQKQAFKYEFNNPSFRGV